MVSIAIATVNTARRSGPAMPPAASATPRAWAREQEAAGRADEPEHHADPRQVDEPVGAIELADPTDVDAEGVQSRGHRRAPGCGWGRARGGTRRSARRARRGRRARATSASFAPREHDARGAETSCPSRDPRRSRRTRCAPRGPRAPRATAARHTAIAGAVVAIRETSSVATARQRRARRGRERPPRASWWPRAQLVGDVEPAALPSSCDVATDVGELHRDAEVRGVDKRASSGRRTRASSSGRPSALLEKLAKGGS